MVIDRTDTPQSWCICGHTGDGPNSEHADTVEPGHGKCIHSSCPCSKFTWYGHMAYDRFGNLIRPQFPKRKRGRRRRLQ